MKGQQTKYYKFESTGSGRLTVPISLAKALGWEHSDNIVIRIETIDQKTGLFFYKE